MTPILRQLRSWQAREWLFSACVAVAAVVLFAAVGVTLACLLDYLWDGTGETPFWARVLLLVFQVVVYAGAGWLAFRFVRTPSAVTLASRAEAAFTEFDHRLVTSLQLNRPEARTRGMSKELIEVVTDEAHSMAGRRTLASLTDPKRLLVAGGLLLPVLLWAAVAFAFFFPLTTALLQRQVLMDAEIPRSVAVTNATDPLFPAGDPVQLRVKVVGPVSETTAGTARVRQADGATESYPLRYDGPTKDGTGAEFVADLPGATEPFTFTAQVKDGRMRKPAEVRFEARPVVTTVDAWVIAPAYVDPDGKKRYEKLANQGDVACHPDCAVRVRAVADKPLKSATLVLVGKGPPEPAVAADGRTELVSKEEVHRLPMAVSVEKVPAPNADPNAPPAEKEVGVATATFGLPPGVNKYRVEVLDGNDFPNLNPPYRNVTVQPDRPPAVALNDELLMPGWETGPADDYQVRGMPLVRNGQIQIGYLARTALGVARVAIIYRVNDGPWTPLTMAEAKVDEEKVGKFRPELGVFETYDVDKNLEFYPLPSTDPDGEPAGLTAGGRYNFQTSALKKANATGPAAELAVGDRVEFRVAVYDRKHAAMEKVLPVALPLLTELTRLARGTDATALAQKADEFAAIRLLPEADADAARAAVAVFPTDQPEAARRLTDLDKRLRAQRPIPMTDTDTASRPPEERGGVGRPAGYSESRFKTVVTPAKFDEWREDQARSRERLREIEKLQQGVFGGGKK